MTSAPLSRPLPRWLPGAVACTAAVLFCLWLAVGVVRNPGFVFLLPRGGAVWIRVPGPATLVASDRGRVVGNFVRPFRLNAPLVDSDIYIAGFRSLRVSIDGVTVLEENDLVQAWKYERRISLPGPLSAGDHLLSVDCANDTGPPMIRVRWPDLGLRSGHDWFVQDARGRRALVALATEISSPPLAFNFPSPAGELSRLSPLLLAIAGMAGAVGWMLSGRAHLSARAGSLFSPPNMRWILIVFLLVLGVNDLRRLDLHVGTDATHHYEYIHYVAAHHRLPPITEGIQTFQAPLFYVLAALLHEALRFFVDETLADPLLRVIPILCGAGLVEAAYQMARRACAENAAAQRLVVASAAFLPAMIVKTQVVSNEPLAALLGAFAGVAVLDLALVSPESYRPRRFAFAGALWGLATLSKVNALVLGAPISLAFAWWVYAWPGAARTKSLRITTFVAAFVLSCGWYLLRNRLLYGKALIAGWDPVVGYEWWQFPGYRTIEQYSSFGVSLRRPVFALVHGFLDGLYSGLWFDGENSGVPLRATGPAWNFPYALAALPLALVPTLGLGAGALRALVPPPGVSANPQADRAAIARCYAVLVVGAYTASILAESLIVPYYNAIKATYALAAVPCIAVLIAAGAEPILRWRWARIAVFAWLAVWCTTIGIAYWALPAT